MEYVLVVQNREPKWVKKPVQYRKEGLVPGVIYGKGMDSLNIAVKSIDLSKCINAGAHIFEVEVGGKKHLVNLESVDRDPQSREFEHVSLHKLQKGVKATVHLPIHIVGEAAGLKQGGLVGIQTQEVSVIGLPKDLPEYIEVDVTNLEVGGHIYLKDVKPAGNWDFLESELELSLVGCAIPKKHEEPEVSSEVVSAQEEAPVQEQESNEEKKSAA